MNKVSLIATNQFGYHTDHYEWARHLSPQWHVEVLCLDSGRPMAQLQGVSVSYVSKECKGPVFKFLGLLKLAIKSLHSKPVFVIKYFPGCSLFALVLGRRKTVLDIRTFSVEPRPVRRYWLDLLTCVESKFFKHVIIVSDELRKKSRIHKASVVGLGGQPLPTELVDEEKRGELRIRYGGSITGREVHIAIESVSLLGIENVELRIAGSGSEIEMELLRSLVQDLELDSKVKLLGYLNGANLSEQLSWANVGLVHVPPLPYYTCQPSTKLYEYMLSGLHLLVSRYGFYEGKLNSSAARFYDFEVKALANAITSLSSELPFKLSKQDIIGMSAQSSWEMVVKNALMPVLLSVEDHSANPYNRSPASPSPGTM